MTAKDGETDLLLRIRDNADGDEGYPVEALLSDGSFFRGVLPLDPVALQAAENRLDALAYGRLLYENLFDGWISHAYESARGIARVQSEGQLRVRLWLDSSDPVLQAVKWERLCHYHNEQFLPISITEATSFSRYTGLGVAERAPIEQRPLKMLVAISNPDDLGDNVDLASLAVEDEVRSLLEALKDLAGRQHLRITLLLGKSGKEHLPGALRDELAQSGYTLVDEAASLDRIGAMLPLAHIFHFVGHGQFSSRRNTTALLLEKEDGSSDWVETRALISTLTSSTQLPHLIFLASCETAQHDRMHPYVGLAAQLVQAGVPAVVAMQETITMSGARQLVAAFYSQLLQHGVVDRALNVARSLLYNDRPGQQGDWSMPVLYMRLRTGRLFSPDPILRAMREMAEDPLFSFFDPQHGYYLPLPVETVTFTDPIQLRRQDRLDPETTGTLDFQKAIRDLLANGRRQSREKATVIGVIGGIGSNKSTQLKKLVWDCLQEGLDPQNTTICCLPLYVDLRDFRPQRSTVQNSLEEHILQRLARYWPDLDARRLVELPAAPALRLIFYGIDLISADVSARIQEQLRMLLHTYPDYDYIIASTETGLNWQDLQDHADLHLLIIQPLRRVKIRHFLENLERIDALQNVSANERATLGKRLLTQIYRSELFDLVAIPWFMVQVLLRAARGEHPSSRTDALQDLVEGALAQLPSDEGISAHAGPTLYALAWEMQHTQCCVLPVSIVFQTMAQFRDHRGYSLETFYKGLLDSELLFATEEGTVSFAYLPFQAYCCAQAIVRNPDREQILEDVTVALGMPAALRWWGDTLVLVAGLLAQEAEQSTLTWFLRRLVEGMELLSGEQLFLAARCLMECKAEQKEHDPEIEMARQLVVQALYWRTDSRNESTLRLRVLATQLLSRVAEPEIIIHLARLVYEKVRTSFSDEKDYEFSSIRMAAAIGLNRIGQPQEVQEILETQFHPSLKPLFRAWKESKLEDLLTSYCDAENAGVQAVAALAIGDVAEQLWASVAPEKGQRALAMLGEQLIKRDTIQSVRWAVADALGMMDARAVEETVIMPYLDDLEGRDGTDDSWKARDKCLAYLIGLTRSSGPSPLAFLIEHCIRGSGDARLWLCAMQALARVGGPEARHLLSNVALDELTLEERIADHGERCILRRTAISLLVEAGDREAIARLRRSPAIKDPALLPTLYRATRDIYWQGNSMPRNDPVLETDSNQEVHNV